MWIHFEFCRQKFPFLRTMWAYRSSGKMIMAYEENYKRIKCTNPQFSVLFNELLFLFHFLIIKVSGSQKLCTSQLSRGNLCWHFGFFSVFYAFLHSWDRSQGTKLSFWKSSTLDSLQFWILANGTTVWYSSISCILFTYYLKNCLYDNGQVLGSVHRPQAAYHLSCIYDRHNSSC